MKDFTIILREHDLKATPQRLALMDIIQHYGHITIDELYLEIKNKFHSISLATIYKNINAMKDKFLLEEVKLPNEKSVYEIKKGKHSHLLCTNCNVITDIDLDIDSKANNVQELYNFNIYKIDIVLSGLCTKCS
jgi:Fur family peroxide stress response transcriptional regulator